MLRSFVKSAVAYSLSNIGVTRRIRSANEWRDLPLVLCYHRVVDDFTRESRHSIPAMLITNSMLEKHLDWVGRHYQFVSMQEACSILGTGEPFTKPSALVTFDDGYRDVYQNALPLLERKGIPATVFVVSGLVGTGRLQIHDELFLHLVNAQSRWQKFASEFGSLLSILGIPNHPRIELQRLFSRGPLILTGKILDLLCFADVQRLIAACEAAAPLQGHIPEGLRPLSWTMLEEMQRAGFAIGSHTASHTLLTNESMTDILLELITSQSELKLRLGGATPYFAYPDGRFHGQAVRAVKSCGYEFAFSTCIHRDPEYPLLTVPRKVLWEKSCVDPFGSFDPTIMECLIARVFDFMSPCRKIHKLPEVSLRPLEAQSVAGFERS